MVVWAPMSDESEGPVEYKLIRDASLLDVEIASDSKVRLETVNRGKAALAWVARLQGTKLLRPISS